MSDQPTYGSLFTGIAGLDRGFDLAGYRCLWQVEVDKYCRQVLRKQYPAVPLHGDITQVRGADLERPDVIIGGSPCQGISLAGHRKGLDDPRSKLWWEFHRILGEVRPRHFLLENVAGLLTSSDGRDLGAIIGSVGELGYSVAWRVLDSQHFGVPQRRRRIYVVGSLGDWSGPGEVLLEPEGVRGDPPPS